MVKRGDKVNIHPGGLVTTEDGEAVGLVFAGSRMICDKCKEKEAEFSSLVLTLCHECAHELGLLHKHKGIPNTTHCLDGFAPNEEIKTHLKEYRNHPERF